MIVRRFNKDDLPEMILIWNEIVEEGNAFSQEEVLTLKTVWIFSTVKVMLELHLMVKFLDYIFSITIMWEDAAILSMLAMQYPQKQEENTLVKNWFWIRWKKQKNLIFLFFSSMRLLKIISLQDIYMKNWDSNSLVSFQKDSD